MTDENLIEKSEKKSKTNEKDAAFSDDFKYSHDNPYHDRLKAFEHFVLRDDESEKNQGNWSKNVFKNDKPIEAYPSAVPILSLNQFAINFEVLKLPKITIPNAITAPYTSKN